ncbi:hypothetical protein SAM23877_p062 (plasmid) [Streptomyces ambofaciens ATCC 23877]|uniref:Uncharacterized protein n=1 Tax=Streptomyces ambofaciens (strain ATCC 23877 / 3486 / DSM 40053 / JCM 4204 / NBRC 12836 / NRRL B-2516) TaxID=278992 RepID=A0A0K2B6G9_STRA7|nr:hypothetical protein [Streptomyces ambofaciens]AKZ60771.1 hypothetical protein SAM23877_p062 [Streptomyces ambofaciens ATCC 23877]
MTARDEIRRYVSLLSDMWTPRETTDARVERLYNAVRTEVLGEALDELTAVKKELAFIESLVCQCQPEREHDDYRLPADHLHAADCIVAAAQQTAAGL